MTEHGIDLTRLYAYWDKQYVKTTKIVARWEKPLRDHLCVDNYPPHKIEHAGQLQHEQPKLCRALCAKILLVPIGKNNGGGAAMLALTLEVAAVLNVPEATAFELVTMLFRMNNRHCPIGSKASYRNTKAKFLTT